MKKLLLAGVSIIGLTASAQAADIMRRPMAAPVMTAPGQVISGDLSLYGGWFNYTSNTVQDFTGSIIGASARANLWFSPTMSVQFDANMENPFEEDDGTNYSVVNLAGHLSWRDSSSLLGLFGSYGYNGFWGDRFGTVGVEGMLYWGNLHLYGQGGYTFATTDSGNNSWYIHGEARFFLNPNLMLAGNLGYVSQDEYDTAINAIRWGLDLEWKHATMPLGAFVSYRGNVEREPDESETQYNHAFLVGIKLHFNNASLQAASQKGATLRDFNPMTGVNHLLWNDNQ